MGEKDIWRPDALTISTVTEGYPLYVANYELDIEEPRWIMDNMYANLFINEERVPGIVNRVVFKEDYFSAIRAFSEVHMDITNFNVRPKINKVIFNDPATIIFWTDGTKTVVKCQEGDTYSKEIGFKTAYLKKMLGNDNTFNKEINKWVWGQEAIKRKGGK